MIQENPEGPRSRRSTWGRNAANGARLRVRLACVAAAILALAAFSGLGARPAAAQSFAAADSSSGALAGAWGLFPARSDSTEAILVDRRTPIWVRIVDTPYYVATCPLHFLGQGAAQVARASDAIGLSRLVGRVFRRRVLPPYTSVGVQGGDTDGYGASFAIAYPAMPGHGDTFRMKIGATTGGDRGGSAGLNRGTEETGEFQVGVGYRYRANLHFFGLGPESRKEDESLYLEESGWAGVSYNRALGTRGFLTRGAATLSSVAARGTTRDQKPPLGETFADDIPPGFKDGSTGITASFELEHDDADDITRPESGGFRRARIAYFHNVDDFDVRYVTYRGELQQFVPLWYNKRALALRAYVAKIEPIGDEPVPFQRLLTNDEPDLLRGYGNARFRDLGLTAATAEYRWPIWTVGTTREMGVDAYAFADIGQVFHDFADVNFDDLTKSYGGGLRLGSWKGFVGRVEYGWSEEDSVIRLRASQTFQFDKGGFLRGKYPVPDR